MRTAGKSESHAVQHVAKLLGVSVQRVSELSQISSSMDEENRRLIQDGQNTVITAKTALVAKSWGGAAYLETLAKQGKQAATDGSISRPTHMTVAAMKKVVSDAPELVREKLKAAIVKGDVVTAVEAEQKGRRLAAERAKHEPLPAIDILAVAVGFRDRFQDWNQKMLEILPFMDVVEDVPAIANDFYTAIAQFSETLNQFLARKGPPRPADHPMKRVNVKRRAVGS